MIRHCVAVVLLVLVCGSAHANRVFCEIGGRIYQAGTVNPANACQSCQPEQTDSAWSDVFDGLSCGSALLCVQGTCTAEADAFCDIDGSRWFAGETQPGNTCSACRPLVTKTAWSVLPDGSSCGAGGRTCEAGVCSGVARCIIDGTTWDAGAADPKNACRVCEPDMSDTYWTDLPVGTSCGVDRQCLWGVCQHI